MLMPFLMVPSYFHMQKPTQKTIRVNYLKYRIATKTQSVIM